MGGEALLLWCKGVRAFLLFPSVIERRRKGREMVVFFLFLFFSCQHLRKRP